MNFPCFFCKEELEEPRNSYGVYFKTLIKVHCYNCHSIIPHMFNDDGFVSKHHIQYDEDTFVKYSEDVIIGDILISIQYHSGKTTIYQYIAGGPTGICTDEILSLDEVLDLNNPKIMEIIQCWITFS